MPSLASLSLLFALLIGLAGCGFETEAPAQDASVRLDLDLGPIGALSKTSAIELRTLDLAIHQGADTAVKAALAITTQTRALDPVYVLPPGSWVAVARVLDIAGKLVYLDSATFVLAPADTALDVRLSLRPRFSRLSLRVAPIDAGSVGKVALTLGGPTLGTISLAETDFTRMGADSSVALAFDYVPTGESLSLGIQVQGKSSQILSRWSGSLFVVPGRDTALRILLKAEGAEIGMGIAITPVATVDIRAEVPTPDPRPFISLVKTGSLVAGRIRNLGGDLGGYRVALVRYAAGGWYSHPTYAHPYADLDADGGFATELVSDSLNAYLVPANYLIPPVSGTISAGFEAAAVATGFYRAH